MICLPPETDTPPRDRSNKVTRLFVLFTDLLGVAAVVIIDRLRVCQDDDDMLTPRQVFCASILISCDELKGQQTDTQHTELISSEQ